jgi:hypothetical protein
MFVFIAPTTCQRKPQADEANPLFVSYATLSFRQLQIERTNTTTNLKKFYALNAERKQKPDTK